MLIALCYALNTLLWFFGIDAWILSYIGGMSLLPIAFLYLASYVFEFCEYHRIFLHYVAIDTILTTIDYRNKIGFDIRLYMILICITLFFALYLHQKERKNDRSDKTTAR